MPPKAANQPLRPAQRYRPGKAPVPVADSDSDEDDDHQQQQELEQAGDDEHDAGEDVALHAPRAHAGPGKLNVALREVEVDTGGKVRVGGRHEVGRTQEESSEGEYETDSEDEAPAAPPKPVFRPKAAAPAAQDEESSEYETDSEEEEEPLKPLYKPVFVSKRNRDTIAEQKKELDPEALEAKQAAEAERRRNEAKNLVADSIVREIASKEAQEVHPDVDDTDGLDPEGEFEAWKLRELTRLKRDREARYALEKIREEVEARRAMPEELRLKEDTERAEKSRKEKPKGNQAFLQRYHHKGVFHQDLDILKKHDYTAPTESTVDVSALPAVMQKRNFGKAHQTKYTHLAAEDTSRQHGGFGRSGPSGAGGAGVAGGAGQGCFVCGGPHLKRDCPQLNDPSSAGGASASGANSSAARSGGDAGWGARPPPPASSRRDEADRYAPSGAGGGPGAGRRQGIGFGDRDRRGGERDRDRDRDERGWRERGGGYDERDRRGGGRDDYYRERDGGERRRRSRSRSRSRSPPPRRRVEYDDDEGDRRRDRRRTRSPPPPSRRDERGGYGGRRDEGRDRDEKRRRLD
ncbi:microfibrillar-associated 1 family protein [Rhodotorula paludigena]|uniref:microfibrillar-associated 1 family protein n=1 Tax=Rhodotorula paludigena TaxID=86838 RepID=UPI00317F2F09